MRIERPRPRQSAAERRTAIVAAALSEFAWAGYAGASTEAIAAGVGISHAYLFKLFGTRKQLFLAVTTAVYDQILATFQEAVATAGSRNRLHAMGDAYRDLLTRREQLQVIMHGFAAATDPEIRELVLARYAEIFRFVRGATDNDFDAVAAFWAQGQLLTIAAAIDLESLAETEDWVALLLDR